MSKPETATPTAPAKPKAVRRKTTETFPSAQLRRVANRNGVPRMNKSFLVKLDRAVTHRGSSLLRRADILKGERHTIGTNEIVRAYQGAVIGAREDKA